ncbi:hypothetical protein J6TS1_06920 [Siminovitchia terrae]|uniref:Uncharacterized protein n=1 Tax=Siminovitchia terrae TaxID=1914933 RepID=A0ABQ4KU75_SIMTE|nr:hypothetical protein J6TS1_06920 [Siminovitchia terrae]
MFNILLTNPALIDIKGVPGVCSFLKMILSVEEGKDGEGDSFVNAVKNAKENAGIDMKIEIGR